MKAKVVVLFVLAMTISMLFGACRRPAPEYDTGFLKGEWIRLSSTDSRSDSMVVEVDMQESIIKYVPATSNFQVGNTKWRNIYTTSRDQLTKRGDFKLSDLSGSKQVSESTIFVLDANNIEVRSIDYPNAPGGYQLWTRKL